MHTPSGSPYVRRMKTSSSTPPAYHFIDIAPLAARFDMLMASIMVFIDAGRMLPLIRVTQDVRQLVRHVKQFEAHNYLLTRKLDMLLDPAWRRRVLKELGGMRRLKSWEKAAARNLSGIKSPAREPGPIWLYTNARRAESERLKAHVRKCARACVSPGVLRDKIRVDFEGEFRLAPIPKGKGFARQEKIYTQGSICDYVFNAMPFYAHKTYGPATVWPAEFRAAAKAEAAILEQRTTPLPSQGDIMEPILDNTDCQQHEDKEPVLARDEGDNKITAWMTRGVPCLSPEQVIAIKKCERRLGGRTA